MGSLFWTGKHFAEILDAVGSCDTVFLFAACAFASASFESDAQEQHRQQHTRDTRKKRNRALVQKGRWSRHDAPHTMLKYTFVEKTPPQKDSASFFWKLGCAEFRKQRGECVGEVEIFVWGVVGVCGEADQLLIL